jgi:hypothetical protein
MAASNSLDEWNRYLRESRRPKACAERERIRRELPRSTPNDELTQVIGDALIVDLEKDIFANCLAEKLLVYATGRDLGFGDKKEVARIVKEVREGGNGLRDLIAALVLSESFGTK